MWNSHRPWVAVTEQERLYNMNLRETVEKRIMVWENYKKDDFHSIRSKLCSLFGHEYLERPDTDHSFVAAQYTDGGKINEVLKKLAGPHGYAIYKAMEAKLK